MSGERTSRHFMKFSKHLQVYGKSISLQYYSFIWSAFILLSSRFIIYLKFFFLSNTTLIHSANLVGETPDRITFHGKMCFHQSASQNRVKLMRISFWKTKGEKVFIMPKQCISTLLEMRASAGIKTQRFLAWGSFPCSPGQTNYNIWGQGGILFRGHIMGGFASSVVGRGWVEGGREGSGLALFLSVF